MLNFLKGTRKLVNVTEPICFVIGNETCDLDSAVCALALAFYYQQCTPPTVMNKKTHFLPILNIPRRDYPIKTEVVHFLQQQGIKDNVLTFRDELPPQQQLAANNFILVDHHVSAFARQCVEVYDHRPYDAACQLPTTCKLTLEQVGSCSTLIADMILQSVAGTTQFLPLLQLLHAVIVMDTVNFSSEAARATPKDHRVTAEIEKLLCISNDSLTVREQIFRELCAARKDVSALSAQQLLHKDMKWIANSSATLKIALPGYPITVQEFVQKPNAAEAVQELARELNCAVVVLIGMKVLQDGSVKRDIGLINIDNLNLFDKVLNKMLTEREPELCLREVENCNFMHGRFYQQENVRVTRKHILPLIKNVLD